ncbi:MAG: hypothetical protein KG003_11010 [Bacteroidetes bacterium]|nr:hypothetical protein [Bacteroidota bacterium]
MKNAIQKATIVLGVALIAITACRKENVQNVVAATGTDTEMTALVDQAGNDMLNTEATAENPEMGVFMVNEGISADFLAEEADMDEAAAAPAGSTDNLRNYARNHSFVACLRKLDLSDRQVEAVKKAMRAYEQCKESAVKRARAIYQKLHDAYQEKAQRLVKAYRNGEISKDKFEAAMKELRKAFHQELRSLQLKEKLDEAFKKCYRGFLENIHSILTERQWKAFVACHKR